MELKEALQKSLDEPTRPFVPMAQRGPDVKPRLRLIDIGEAALAIQDALFEMQGELTPEMEKALDDLLAHGADKLDAAAWVVRKLAGDAETCKAEAKRYQERAGAIERQGEALKSRMLFAVDAAFSGKLKTASNTIWGQNSGDVTMIDLAADADETSLKHIQQANSALIREKLELNKTEITHRFEAGESLPPEISVQVIPGKRSLRIR